MWAKYDPPDKMANDFSNMAPRSPPDFFLINKSRSKCSRQHTSPDVFINRTSKARPSILYIFLAGLVILVLSAYRGIGPPRTVFLHWTLSSERGPFVTSEMVLPQGIGPWVAFFPSLFGSVAARLAWDGASAPTARQEDLPGAVSYVIATGTSVDSSTATSTTATSSSTPTVTSTVDSETYTAWAVSAIEALQTWYDVDTGLWLSTNWWNAANCLTVLGDFFALDADRADDLDLADVFSNTFAQAQLTTTKVRKTFRTRGDGLRVMESRYYPPETTGGGGAVADTGLAERGYSGFINDYYDDEGWWALAWIRAYDVTGVAAYLATAESIFRDMQGGQANATCGGGIWWDKGHTYKNAIANELYLAVAASLARRAAPGTSAAYYLGVAERQWAWFRRSGMINGDGLVNDGLTIYANGTCANNRRTVWSYNQGVVLGGLVELYRATGRPSLLSEAVGIAEAAIGNLSVGGILHEPCEDDDCAADGSQFKGMSLLGSSRHHKC